MKKTMRSRKRRGGSVVAALVVILAATGLIWAQANRQVSGKVLDQSGQPVAGALVVLSTIDEDGNVTSSADVFQAKTKKKGQFRFSFVKLGNYAVTVEGTELRPVSVTLKLRTLERKMILGPDGPIEDLTGAVDPLNPQIQLGIPPGVAFVTIDLTLDEPPSETASAGAGAPADAAAADPWIIEDPEPGLDAVVEQIQSGQLTEALAGVQELLVESPDEAKLHYLNGYTLVRLERQAEAEAPLLRALELAPEMVGIAGLIGRIYFEQERFGESATMTARELELVGDGEQRAGLLLALGQALLESGQLEPAIEALEEAYALDKESTEARVQLADAYMQADREAEAETLMSDSLDPAQAAVLHYNLGLEFLHDENWERGAEHMRKALELNPELTTGHSFLAQAYLAMGDMESALKHYEAYVEAEPFAKDAEQANRLIEALRQNVNAP